MNISLIGLPDDHSNFQNGNAFAADVKFDPPSTDLLDNHGYVPNDGGFIDWGAVEWFDNSLSSGIEPGYASWAGEVTYFHKEFGTVWNVQEWTVEGSGMTTYGQSFDITDNGYAFHIDFTRATVSSSGAETWMTQYTTTDGQNAGTVITTFSENGLELHGFNSNGDLAYHKRY
jgi:hypothetical protein